MNRLLLCRRAAMVALITSGLAACAVDDSAEEEDVASAEAAIDGYELADGPVGSATIGSLVSIDFVAPPGHSAVDWIGLHPVGGSANQFIDYQYIGGVDSGTVQLSLADAVDGQAYVFEYLIDNGYTVMASSDPFTATAPIVGYAVTGVPAVVLPGAAATISWSAPANHSPQDWIGLFASGAANDEITAYAYLGGSSSGSIALSLPANAAPGTSYETRYFLANTYQLATSGASVVAGNALSGPAAPVAPGGSVPALWNAPANHSTTDWVGLFKVGAANNAIEGFGYVSSAGSASGSLTLALPQDAVPQTHYELRYFVNNTYQLVGVSSAFSVAASLSAPVGPVAPGAVVSSSWSAPASHSATDWIGLYKIGAGNGAPSSYAFVDAVGQPSGSVSLTIPSDAVQSDQYEFRYFINNTYELVGRSAPFAVGVADVYVVNGPSGPVVPGSDLQVAWSGPVGHSASDWIGLFAVGAASGEIISYGFVGAQGDGTGSVIIPIPANASGSYELRYHTNNSYAVVASSAPFSIP